MRTYVCIISSRFFEKRVYREYEYRSRYRSRNRSRIAYGSGRRRVQEFPTSWSVSSSLRSIWVYYDINRNNNDDTNN